MLFRQYLRREAGTLLGWAVSLVAIVLPLVGAFRLMMNSDGMKELSRVFEQLPPALRVMFGGTANFTLLDGWLQAQVFNFVIPLVLAVYTAMATLGILTREMDGHTMDFLLALPIRRSELLLSRLGGLALNLGFLHLILLGSIGLGVRLIGEQPHWQAYALTLVNEYLVYLALACLLLLVTVFIDDYQRGLMTTVGAALLLYLVPHTIDAGSSLSWLRQVSLFAYFDPGAILRTGSLVWRDLLTLLVATAGLTALATWLFERKQLSI